MVVLHRVAGLASLTRPRKSYAAVHQIHSANAHEEIRKLALCHPVLVSVTNSSNFLPPRSQRPHLTVHIDICVSSRTECLTFHKIKWKTSSTYRRYTSQTSQWTAPSLWLPNSKELPGPESCCCSPGAIHMSAEIAELDKKLAVPNRAVMRLCQLRIGTARLECMLSQPACYSIAERLLAIPPQKCLPRRCVRVAATNKPRSPQKR